ncbi:hypothetical protein LG943_24085 [Streptomonospora sp. S1-112]|uniref:Uncharacterized protein n=1 Tax=Streptomonospora mangrovi TaxID=2883123 RepID=A0A9X3NQ02_9ACTN|nr:hypothetical protein [Streptomonospora mangrovi]MDA0567377.1 hypothetical protein [Streptomonospora mangrovi]
MGSVPLADAEAVFRAVSSELGDLVARIPDGETGPRDNWVVWQLPLLQEHPDLETVSSLPEYGPGVRVKVRDGVDPSGVEFGPLGYARAALESWPVFARLQAEGVIPAHTRFQVSLPTPIAVVAAFTAVHQTELERAYEARLLAELAEITAAVPADRLAVQWDCAVEFALQEGVFPAWFGDGAPDRLLAGIVERMVRLGEAVPTGVPLGYHLCYGDFGHAHFVQPADTTRLAAVANGVAAGLSRPLDWLHLPVPRDRDDTAYFLPLKDLSLPEGTALYLGLVHATDGIEGGRRRLAAAKEVVDAFGVATECGLGRRPAGQLPGLFATHAALAREAAAGSPARSSPAP